MIAVICFAIHLLISFLCCGWNGALWKQSLSRVAAVSYKARKRFTNKLNTFTGTTTWLMIISMCITYL